MYIRRRRAAETRGSASPRTLTAMPATMRRRVGWSQTLRAATAGPSYITHGCAERPPARRRTAGFGPDRRSDHGAMHQVRYGYDAQRQHAWEHPLRALPLISNLQPRVSRIIGRPVREPRGGSRRTGIRLVRGGRLVHSGQHPQPLLGVGEVLGRHTGDLGSAVAHAPGRFGQGLEVFVRQRAD